MINKNDNINLKKSEKIYKELKNHDIDVLLDDTEENISAKMKKFNLIGIPYQIIIGQKSQDDLLEFKEIERDTKKTSLEKIIKSITEEKNSN